MDNYQQPYSPTFTPYNSYSTMSYSKAPNASTTLTWQWIQGGVETAKNWNVSPGTTVALWDSNEQVIYLKSTDTTGRPTIKTLDYTIREENLPTGDYVTRADFEKLSKSLEELRSKINSKEAIK